MFQLPGIIFAYLLVQLHGPNGQQIDINPHEVSSLREPQKGSDEHFAKGVRCLIKMSNGAINAVTEDCETVRRMIEELKEQK
jgi:hypothetical protein